ncbi:MAG: hypothetical protein R6V36_08680 [Psychroflexus sp.]
MAYTRISENIKENFNQKRVRKCKLITQISLRTINPEAYKDFNNFICFLEQLSRKNRDIFHFFWESDKRERSGYLSGIYPTTATIGKKVGCNEKTVDRYNKNCHSVVAHKRRTKGGKQTSNLYKLNNHARKWLRICDKVGLFKHRQNSHAFNEILKLLSFLHQQFGSNWERIMKALNKHKGYVNKGLKDDFKQAKIKMSLGDALKCPSSSYSSSSYPRICTSSVHIKGVKDFKRWLHNQVKRSLDDFEWFLGLEKGCYNIFGFLKSRFMEHINQKTC